MAEGRFDIDADIRRAKGPPAALYHDPAWFERQREVLFPSTWHFATRAEGLEEPGRVRPFTLLEGCLDEPLLLVRDSKGTLNCLSNVCTHRGNLIVEGEWTLETLRCRYHGRRFHLDGTFAYMPRFEGCEHFPGDSDYLPRVAVAEWRGLVFASLKPRVAPDRMVAPLEERIGDLPLTDWSYDPDSVHDRVVEANWVLVMENLIDAFHVPVAHVWRRSGFDPERMRTELFEHGSVRIEYAARDQEAFDATGGSPDGDRRVAAMHFAVFPTTVCSVYPWGLWMTSASPLGPTRTRVRSMAFVGDRGRMAPAGLEPLFRERDEDEALLEVVQRGVRSRLYRGGRYSPTAERAVHHFHRQLAARLG